MSTIFVLTAGILWSFSGILVKEIHWNALAIAATRSLIGGALQFAFLIYLAQQKNVQENPKLRLLEIFRTVAKRLFAPEHAHWLGAIFFMLNMLALVWAFQLTTAATAVFLHYSGIVLVALLSWPILKQGLSRQDWLAVLTALLGIGLLSVDGLRFNVSGTALGIFCGLTMAATQICLGLRSKQVITGSEALETIVLANLLMVLIGLPFILTAPLMMPLDRAWPFLLLIGIVPWGIPDILYAIGIKQVPVFRAMILGLSDPILTAFWTLIFINEVPSKIALVGAATIMAAIIYQTRYATVKPQAALQ